MMNFYLRYSFILAALSAGLLAFSAVANASTVQSISTMHPTQLAIGNAATISYWNLDGAGANQYWNNIKSWGDVIYDVNVTREDDYKITLNYSAPQATSLMLAASIASSWVDVTPNLPATGSYDTYASQTAVLHMTVGVNQLYLVSLATAGFNISGVTIAPNDLPAPAAGSSGTGATVTTGIPVADMADNLCLTAVPSANLAAETCNASSGQGFQITAAGTDAYTIVPTNWADHALTAGTPARFAPLATPVAANQQWTLEQNSVGDYQIGNGGKCLTEYAVQQLSTTAPVNLDITDVDQSSIAMLETTGAQKDWGNMQTGAYVEYALNVPAAGIYMVTLKYSAGIPTAVTNFFVNNVKQATESLTSINNSWTSYTNSTPVALKLPAGIVKLKIMAPMDMDGWYNIAGVTLTAHRAKSSPAISATESSRNFTVSDCQTLSSEQLFPLTGFSGSTGTGTGSTGSESTGSGTTTGSGSGSGSPTGIGFPGSTGTGSGTCVATSAGLDGVADTIHPSGMAPPTASPPNFTQLYTDDFTAYRWNDWAFPQGFQYANTWVGGNTSVHDNVMDLLGSFTSGNEAVVGWAQLSNNALQTYGKYLVRMRADPATNLAIAPLLWPTSGVWPAGGEVDFAEDDIGTRQAYAFSHYAGSDGSNQQTTNGPNTSVSMSDWHTWGVEWTPTSLTFTVDGTVWATQTLAAAIPHDQMWLGFVMSCGVGPCPQGMNAHWLLDWVDILSYTPGTAANCSN